MGYCHRSQFHTHQKALPFLCGGVPIKFTSLDNLPIQRELALGDFDDPLLHGTRGNKTEDTDLLLLTDTMRSETGNGKTWSRGK